jgi:hypothetical protein
VIATTERADQRIHAACLRGVAPQVSSGR